MQKDKVFGLAKTINDAHTMGIHAAASLLRDCGYKVVIAPLRVEDAISRINSVDSKEVFIDWIKTNKITNLGISYRLDPDDAVKIVGKIVALLKKEDLYEALGASIKSIHFAGLKDACDIIDTEYAGRICTFRGGESAEESLVKMGVSIDEIPFQIIEGCKYDKKLYEFGKRIINSEIYKDLSPCEKVYYSKYGTIQDNLIDRLNNNFIEGFKPLIRAHSGPYHANVSREKCLEEYYDWCRELATAGFLDILSIGTSQLSQSKFGENWEGYINGGGVPVNSEDEYIKIWEASRPMLVRTYSATKNVRKMAEMYERTINNAWNALSLWWFDELDGRGLNNLLENLYEHIETIHFAGAIGKPVETNVPHHFAFRGCDDITYIVSEYLAAKVAKINGVTYFVMQNMLNTPRSTWGIQDIAKSRAMLKLVKELEDDGFKVILQTRAGLDYFKPDIEEAKVQLAAVTCLMDDIDPDNIFSPQIIHVVSYSEALFLATPDVLNESIKITRCALDEYRKEKRAGLTPDVWGEDIISRTDNLYREAKKLIGAMEDSIPNLYTAEGLYVAFCAGWLPVPELWSDKDEFIYAKCWQSKHINGGVSLVDNELLMPMDTRINRCISNIPNALYNLKMRYGIDMADSFGGK